MTANTTTNDTSSPASRPYLDVVRLDDGRYCVQFIKNGTIPRTSYTSHATAVVKQAQRAGNIPIRTDDADLLRICADQVVDLI